MVEKQIDKKLTPFQVGLTGKLITSTDPSRLILEEDGGTQIDNFKSLKNIRYTDNGVRGISGMTKINTTALTSHPKIQAIHQFTKSQPAENHILVQAFNSGETESKVFRNDTAIPNQGDFNSTALHTDASGAGKGRFENSQLGKMVYCNGVETMVWGGNESRLSKFVIYDEAADSFSYDYTEKAQNTLSDTNNLISFFQDSDPKVTLRIGNIFPISGIKFTVNTANATPGIASVFYWNGSAWAAVTSQVDGTDSPAGTSMGQTGTITFGSES